MNGKLPDNWIHQPCRQGMLSVGSEHDIHWRTYGNKNLQAVLFLHGGPGSGVNISSLCFFDPDIHYVVMFDQRGAGQSTPPGCIENNTTQHLIADIELLRNTLGITHWIVFGGSWGATLGLLYSQYHAQACIGLVLRGVSNSHDYQNRWMLEDRPKFIPDRHQAFMKHLDEAQQTDPVEAHYQNISSNDVVLQLQALNAINVLESGMIDAEPESLASCVEFAQDELNSEAFNRAKIYLHYWRNKKFIDNRQCLPNPEALSDKLIIFIHGESDWICPIGGAREIAKAFAHATFISVPGAGHTPFQADMTKALHNALEEFVE